MNQHYYKRINYCLFTLLILFSVELKDLTLAKKEMVQEVEKVVPLVPEKKSQVIKRPKVTHKKFVVDTLDQLDRDGFLASFQRQAQEALLACLRSSMGQGYVLFNGVLSKKGQLRRLGQIGDSHSVRNTNAGSSSNSGASGLSECAETAILNMNFSELTKNFRDAYLEVQWRVDF